MFEKILTGKNQKFATETEFRKTPQKTVSSKYFNRLPLIIDTDVGDVNVTDIMSVIVPLGRCQNDYVVDISRMFSINMLMQCKNLSPISLTNPTLSQTLLFSCSLTLSPPS